MTVHADATRRHRIRPAGGDDAGFTLIEVVVSVAIIAVVMLGVGAVFVATAAGTDAQGLRQTAARIATDGLDRAHALSGADVVKGRDQDSVTSQWSARPAAVGTLLTGLTAASDPTATSGQGTTDATPLPTTAKPFPVDGVTFQRSFFVATCQLDTVGTCGAASTAGSAPMYDVVVSVAWPDHTCTRGTCTYQLSTLIAASVNDPLFNTNIKALPPTVGAIANQVLDVQEAVTGLTATFSGGNGAVSLTAGGLPPGVTFDSASGRFGGAPLSATSTTVTITATDRFSLTGSTTFVWTVNPLPKITDGALTAVTGIAANAGLADLLHLTDGTAPVAWSCTGLPAGIALDRSTGVVSGLVTATALTPVPVPCTVTDARGKTSAATLTLTVVPAVTITPATATIALNRKVSQTFTAAGCVVACTWTKDTLPKGLTLDPVTGTVTGTPAATTPSTSRVTATDTLGRTATSVVTWTAK